jgi:hypothetical protein
MTADFSSMDDRERRPSMEATTHRAVSATLRADRKAQSCFALRAFFDLATRWKLNVREQMTLLGVSARSTYFQWKRYPDVVLPRDTMERISYLLAIDDVVGTMLPGDVTAQVWLRQPNQAALFAGCSALDRMLAGHVADLFEVHRYLDAQRRGLA